MKIAGLTSCALHNGDHHQGLALLPGTDFQDGMIEADLTALRDSLASKTTAPNS